MTLAQLNYFVKVAENGHLTQTAKELLIAQPSLTQAIRKLEEELGFLLFEKKGRVLFLTKEGKEFLPYAKEVVEASKRAEQTKEHIYQRYTGNIRFAYTRPMPPNYIPNLLREFFKTNKDKKINIESYAAATSVILRDLKEDKIDFGFCSIGEKEDPDIKMITLMEYPIKLVVNQKDVLGKMKRLHPEDLMSKPGISYTEGSAMDREINEFFKEQEITPDIHYRTSSEEIQNFVACGLGWAFIAQNGTPMKKGLKILEMPEMTLKRETCLAMRKDRQLSKNAQNFLKFTLSYNENFL